MLEPHAGQLANNDPMLKKTMTTRSKLRKRDSKILPPNPAAPDWLFVSCGSLFGVKRRGRTGRGNGGKNVQNPCFSDCRARPCTTRVLDFFYFLVWFGFCRALSTRTYPVRVTFRLLTHLARASRTYICTTCDYDTCEYCYVAEYVYIYIPHRYLARRSSYNRM